MTNKQILLRLRIEYIVYILLALLLVALYELQVFTKGTMEGHTTAVYVLECIGVLLTVVLVPLALKSFHVALERIAEKEEQEHRRSYVKWNEIRLAMFVVVVLVNISIYYVASSTTCGYCAVIGAIASLFCLPPTKKGLMADLTPVEEEKVESPVEPQVEEEKTEEEESR